MDTSIDAFFESVIIVKFGPDRKSVDIIDQTEAVAIREEDVAISRGIGEAGFKLLQDGLCMAPYDKAFSEFLR